MNNQIILECKDFINNNMIDEFKTYVLNLPSNLEMREYIFQQVYIHACLKKNNHLTSWLKKEIYDKYFTSVQQIDIRHMFSYGKYLLLKGEKNKK